MNCQAAWNVWWPAYMCDGGIGRLDSKWRLEHLRYDIFSTLEMNCRGESYVTSLSRNLDSIGRCRDDYQTFQYSSTHWGWDGPLIHVWTSFSICKIASTIDAEEQSVPLAKLNKVNMSEELLVKPAASHGAGFIISSIFLFSKSYSYDGFPIQMGVTHLRFRACICSYLINFLCEKKTPHTDTCPFCGVLEFEMVKPTLAEYVPY